MRSVYRVFLAASILGFGAPLVGEVPARSKPASRPQTYGTSVVSYVEIPGAEFAPLDSAYAYSSNNGARYSTNCVNFPCFGAPLHLPAGAKIVYLELDFIDTNVNFSTYGSLVQCDYAGQNCTLHPSAGGGPMDCLVPGLICSGNAFSGGQGFQSADLTPDGITVSNFNNSQGLLASNFSADNTTQIGGMIVGYVLQVSPDPSFATFADVPIGNPYHQFVEALYASGITGGCGSGNFCPNDPLTRGQMVVFLSVALGLQWQ